MEGRVEEAHEHGEPHGDDHAHGHPHDAAARQVHPLLHQVGLAQHEGGVGEHEPVPGTELDRIEGDGLVSHGPETLLRPPEDFVALALLWIGWKALVNLGNHNQGLAKSLKLVILLLLYS